MPGVVTAIDCDDVPGNMMPLDHASAIVLPVCVWADVVKGDPAGKVDAPGIRVAVWLMPVPSEFANRMLSPTCTLRLAEPGLLAEAVRAVVQEATAAPEAGAGGPAAAPRRERRSTGRAAAEEHRRCEQDECFHCVRTLHWPRTAATIWFERSLDASIEVRTSPCLSTR